MSQIARWLETRSCFALLKSKEQRAFAFASLVFGRFRISESLLVELAAPQDKIIGIGVLTFLLVQILKWAAVQP
jgi:hypothetical protein